MDLGNLRLCWEGHVQKSRWHMAPLSPGGQKLKTLLKSNIHPSLHAFYLFKKIFIYFLRQSHVTQISLKL